LQDYYDSGYYFYNANPLYLPNAGLTHFRQVNSYFTWSAYRLHVTDPLTFNDGIRLTWRNGGTIHMEFAC
jgi:hypothetical protein